MNAGNSFGAWLKNFRQARGLTQERLAEKLGFASEYVRKLEAGSRPPTRGFLKPLAQFVGLQENEIEKFIEDWLSPYPHPAQKKSETDKAAEAPAPGDPPYKGLNFFAVTDAHLYFGRNALTDEVVRLLAESHQGNNRFLIVIGASGSGKSSLVRAGVVPALSNGAIAGSEHWLIKILTPTEHPLKALAVALSEGESDKATLQLMDDLTSDARVLDLRASKLLANVGLPSARLLIIIDQFEELFTLCKDLEERRAYIDNLLKAAQTTGPTIVILTLRADFYRHCLEHEPLRPLLEHNTKTVGPMRRAELREAIVGPAAANNWHFEPGLVELFLDDVGDEPGALPLLSHALRETWEHRQGHTLMLASYSQIGRVQGAIATTADRILAGLDIEQKLVAKRIFLRLTELGEGAEDTRRRVRLDEFLPTGEEPQDVEQVLKILADARLIITHGAEAEVAHEALIREWPLLREWLADDREGLRVHRRLTECANEWQHAQFDQGILYRGLRLDQAFAWIQEHPRELNDLEQRFLETSQSAVQAAEKAEAAARTRELEQQRLLAEGEAKRAELAEARTKEAEAHAKEQRITAIKLTRIRNFLIVAVIVALFLATLAGLFGIQSNRNAAQAEVSARLANAERLAVQARFLSESTNPHDLDVALLSASEAVKLTLLREGYVLANAELALVESIDAAQRNQWQLVLALPHPASVSWVAYSPDGQLLVTASDDSMVRVWDVKSGKLVHQLADHTVSVKSAAFSPDGKLIASASEDRTVRIWSVAIGKQVGQLTGHTASVMSAMFSPDGQQIVSASADQTVRIWDVDSGKQVRQLMGHTGTVWSAVFSPDGQQVVSASEDGTARIWERASGKEVHQLVANKGAIWAAAFSPDGQQIVSAEEDNRMRVWNVASGKELHIFYSEIGGIRLASFSPDSQQIVGADGGLVRLWNAASEKEVRQPISHTVTIRSVAFSPDGQQIVSASEDGMVRIWAATAAKSVRQLLGHTASVRSAAFSPDGERIVSASEDTTMRIWDAKSGQVLGRLTGHADSVRAAVFSPDDQLILSASEDQTVRIWHAKTGKEVRQLIGHEGAVWSAMFSPDGQQIVSGGQDTTVRIWDVVSGKQVRQLTGHEQGVWSVAFSPDGERVVSASEDGAVLLWDVASGQQVRQLLGHLYSVWSVAFSPDGQQIVSAGEDGTVRIWDVASGQEVRQLLGHTTGVRSAVFSPDGQQIASASADKTIRIWDVGSGKAIRQLLGHTERVLSVTYSPDGQQIMSTSADMSVRLWGASIETLLAQARVLIQRDPPVLTTEERQPYGLQ